MRARDRRNRAIARANDRAEALHRRQVEAFLRCRALCSPPPARAGVQELLPVVLPGLIAEPVAGGGGGGGGGPSVVSVTPEEAALVAVARLRFPDSPPRVGPSPDVNRWKMAAVGYPLWLSAGGPGSVGPVSDSVGELSVALEARVLKTVFGMGDGQTVSCVGLGTAWSRAVRPGEESASCGYRYTRPSLPGGSYTVTATTHWEVLWTVNDASGVIVVPRSSTAELPVGELQVLTR